MQSIMGLKVLYMAKLLTCLLSYFCCLLITFTIRNLFPISGSKLFDTLMALLKECFEQVIFKKKSGDFNKSIQTTHVIVLFCLFCCFTSQVNSYGHGGTVSSPNHIFFLSKLEQAFVHILSLVTDNNPF